MIDRVEEWRRFAAHMEQYIQERTVGKYGPAGGDLMTLTDSPLICAWNILKYALRFWHGRGKPHDMEKVAHYACMAWGMIHKEHVEATGIYSSEEPNREGAPPAL